MGIVLTVDLATCSKGEIARAAKFMLESIGYESSATSTTQPPAGMRFMESSTAVIAPQIVDELEDLREVLDEAPAHEVPTVAPKSPPPGIEVDSQGVPWDVRIHAASRAKIADGTWRQRRNLDETLFKAVMDELRATMGVERRVARPSAPPPPAASFAFVPPVPPAPPVVAHVLNVVDGGGEKWPPQGVVNVVVPPPAPFVDSAPPPAAPVSTTPSVPASAGAAPSASPGSTPPSFPQLMQRITAAFTQKTLTQADISAAVQKAGLASLPMLASRPDLVADVATNLGIAL